jgi:hypothetical protein
MIFFDNVSHIKDEFNDVLCQSCTGGYQVARKLYTDNDIVAYKLQKCLILNGIMDISEKPDLLDRSISIKFERIAETDRLLEKQLFADFERELPYLLGSAFKILSQAMAIYPNVKLDKLPRLADFALWCYCIAEALEIGGDNFLKIYAKNRNDIGLDLIQSNATAKAILDFMKQLKKGDCKDKDEDEDSEARAVNNGHWIGSVREFFKDLESFAKMTGINRDDRTWVRNENSLGKKLEEMKVSLSEQGVHFDKRNIGTNKELTIKYTKKQQ